MSEKNRMAALKKRMQAIARRPGFMRGAKAYSDHWREYCYGSADDSIVEIAEEIRSIQRIDETALTTEPDSPLAPIREEQSRELSAWLLKVKRAATDGDAEFFKNMATAIEMLEKPRSAKVEVIHFAFLILLDYRRAGIVPRKKDIQDAVEESRKKVGKISGGISWQRDVWKLPMFAGIKDRRKGEAERPLPPEWR